MCMKYAMDIVLAHEIFIRLGEEEKLTCSKSVKLDFLRKPFTSSSLKTIPINYKMN